jgi:hypothetical protein
LCVGTPYRDAMDPCDTGSTRELLEAVIAAFAVLGGLMAYFSGYAAATSIAESQPPHVVAQRINEGAGEGFVKGVFPAILALIIVVWN